MTNISTYLFLLVISIDISISRSVLTPLVNVENYGKLKGLIKFSENGSLYYSFEGVPYAKPPSGENRFRAPLPLEPWKGILRANKVHKCLQYRHLNVKPNPEDPIIGSEDCLYLNIYTPNLNSDANLDVIVFIHGGAFMFNWGAFQKPDNLLNNNVIYINLNYRLGPLGFMSTEDDVLPGNNGLLDQIEALKWIKNNIKYFGGNPDSITITGNSAGAASVHLHYLMPQSRGLFTRGVSQSGTALNSWVIQDKPLEKTKTIAAHLNCTTESNAAMVECMRNLPGRNIVSAIKLFQPWLYNPFSPFGVVVDSWSSSPLLKQHPYALLKNQEVYDVPWLPSHTNSEGLYPAAEFYSKDDYLPYIEKHWDEIIQYIMQYNDTLPPERMLDVAHKIRNKYLKGDAVTKETFNQLVQAIGDRLFVVDIQKAVKLHARAVKSPVYLYYFKYRGSHSRSDTRTGTNLNFGAAHADDASYIFNMNLPTRSNAKDKQMSEFMIRIWLSYARAGVPDVSPFAWERVSRDSDAVNFFTITTLDDMKMQESSNLGNADFWNSLRFQENERFYSN